ncbi:ankyrin repeat and BTB/POZ domain-containing protein 2-like, partial [Anneissia japonica]|uniref:ankyrin repeat and BTB/POZ domain-containing protein 2-like n=1 Tax=Anneissia japonica TaxID=1529436 RepID=UPI001425566F
MAGLQGLNSAFDQMHFPVDSSNSGRSSCATSHSSHSRSNSSSVSKTHIQINGFTPEFKTNHQGSYDTLNTSFPDDNDCTERFTRMVELERVPWTNQHVAVVLQNTGTRHVGEKIPIDIIQRLSYLLQRPLLRIAKEAKRLSSLYEKCSKNEIHTAIKIVFSQTLAESCLNAALKSLSLYQMNGEQYKQSKSVRAGLIFSVGKFFRWLVDSQVALRIHELSAVYLAACMENLLVEMFNRIVINAYESKEGYALTIDLLEYGIANDCDLWGVLQSSEHLVCGRNSA